MEEPTITIFDEDEVLVRGSVTLDDFTIWIKTPYFDEKFIFDKSHGFEKISKRIVMNVLVHTQNRYFKGEKDCSTYTKTLLNSISPICKYDYDIIYNEMYPSKPKSARNV